MNLNLEIWKFGYLGYLDKYGIIHMWIYKWLCFIYYVSKSNNAKIFSCAIYMQKVD